MDLTVNRAPRPSGHRRPVMRHTVAMLAALAAAGCGDGGPREVARWAPAAGHDVRCVVFSPDGKRLAVGIAGIGTKPDAGTYWKGRIGLYEVGSGKVVAERDVSHWPNAVTFAPQGDLLAVGSGTTNPEDPHTFDRPTATGELALYTAPGLEEKGRFRSKLPDSEVTAVTAHQDGGSLYGLVRSAGGKRGEIRRWACPSLAEEWVASQQDGDEFSALALTADGGGVLVGDRRPPTPRTPGVGTVHMLDSRTGERQATLDTTANSAPTHLAVSPDGDRVVAFPRSDVAQVLDVGKKNLIDSPLSVSGGSGFRDAHFSPDGAWFASLSYTDGSGPRSKLWLMDRKTGRVVSWKEWDCRFKRLAFSPDGKLLAAVGYGKHKGWGPLVAVWQVP